MKIAAANAKYFSVSALSAILTEYHNHLDTSLLNFCHQIIYGKINISLPPPAPYKRTVWEYGKANVAKITAVLNPVDWKTIFCGFGSDDMADIFTNITYSILSENIPNKIIKCTDKDPPWINNELKTAIKRKHRVFKKFLVRGRRQEDWNLVKEVRNETSKMITDTKEKYYQKLGHKLSYPNQGVKAYWTVLNRLLNKKKTLNIPPLLENGIFVTNVQTKANIFNNYFVEQCSAIPTGSTLPTFLPKCNNSLETLAIDREKVLKIIRS